MWHAYCLLEEKTCLVDHTCTKTSLHLSLITWFYGLFFFHGKFGGLVAHKKRLVKGWTNKLHLHICGMLAGNESKSCGWKEHSKTGILIISNENLLMHGFGNSWVQAIIVVRVRLCMDQYSLRRPGFLLIQSNLICILISVHAPLILNGDFICSPWIEIGDFNETLLPAERKGSEPFHSRYSWWLQIWTL